jgi:hypothetical protein
MREKKGKHLACNSLLNFDDVDEEGFIVEIEPETLEIGNAYSISLNYNNEGTPQIYVKTYGDIDIAKLKQMIKERYPNAQLRVLETTPTVELIKPTRPSRKKRKRPIKRKNKEIKSKKKQNNSKNLSPKN